MSSRVKVTDPPRGDVAVTGSKGRERKVFGWIDYAAWLSDEIAVLVGWFPGSSDRPPELELVRDGRRERLQARTFCFPRHDTPLDDSDAGKVVTVRLRRPSSPSPRLGRLMIRGDRDERSRSLGPSELGRAVTELRTLALGGLLSIDPDVRTALMAFLADAPGQHGVGAGRRSAFRQLAMLHGLLRPRRSPCEISRDRSQGLVVDEILRVDDGAFFVRGWARDGDAGIEDLSLVTPAGARVPVLGSAYRHRRPDVERFYAGSTPFKGGEPLGFLCYVEVDDSGVLADGWRAEMRNLEGTVTETPAPPVKTDPSAVRDAILAQAGGASFPEETLLREHVRPALARLQRRLLEEAGLDVVTDHGRVPTSPAVSMVVPLYRRIDFLEYQLAHFVHDRGLAEAELIYVLDSPEQAEELARNAWQLHELYGLPFRVAVLRRNAGFAGANNVGASLATGRLLLLLNSDVLPEAPGWLDRIVAFHDGTSGLGALAPKLLFEDGSLQHAGLYFRRQPGSSVWENAHYFKGLQGELPEANVSRRVPAVTAACLMMDRSLYSEVGGLRGEFVQGDYEDSDLCLRLRELGRQIWYLPDVALYHLEGQSYPSERRRLASRYNAWLHTHLWGDTIRELMEDGGAIGAGIPVGLATGPQPIAAGSSGGE